MHPVEADNSSYPRQNTCKNVSRNVVGHIFTARKCVPAILVKMPVKMFHFVLMALNSWQTVGSLITIGWQFKICCPRDCFSRYNGGTSGAPLKPLIDDSALRTLSSLNGLRWAPEVPPLCRETQSLGQQMLERWEKMG